MRYIVTILLLVACSWATEPLESILVTIPEYTKNEIGGLHYVNIPGGKLLMQDRAPRLPFYPVTVNYPAGYYVQEVKLIQKSGRKVETGVLLPAIEITVDTAESAQPPRRAVTQGWYPGRDFDWRIWPSPQAGTDLVLSVYPMQYNSLSAELVFHREFQFRVKYVKTGITGVNLTADKSAYQPGEPVKLRLNLEAITEAKNIVLKPSVRGPVTLSLPMQGAKVLAGDTTLLLEWQTRTSPVGDYTIELLVNDEAGNTLARVQEQVRVGIPAGELVSFTAEPNPFRIGDEINLTLEFQNTGSYPLSGEGVFRLFREDSVITEFSSPYASLAPGSSTTLTRTWNTGQAEKGGNYYVTAFVRYDGSATPVQQARLSTNRPPSAKFSFTPEEPAPGQAVAFDASSSTDADGEIVDYRWDFGDGATARGIKTVHRYQLPGVYGVRLTVTDNEGGIMTETQPVEIKE